MHACCKPAPSLGALPRAVESNVLVGISGSGAGGRMCPVLVRRSLNGTHRRTSEALFFGGPTPFLLALSKEMGSGKLVPKGVSPWIMHPRTQSLKPSRAAPLLVPAKWGRKNRSPKASAFGRPQGRSPWTKVARTSSLLIYLKDMPRRAAPCPPGTPGRRRRRWRCGSSCRHSPTGPPRPRCRRRPRW